MPFSRPTLSEIQTGIQTDIDSRLPGADSSPRRSVLGVLSRALSGAVHGLYGFQAWVARQVFPDTAEKEYLDRWSGVWGISRAPAAKSAGNVDFTGNNGAAIPSGTVLRRADGAEYSTDALATITGGTATAAVTAIEAAAVGDAGAGSTLTFVSPVAGVDSAATVAAGGLAGGADQEADTTLLPRLLARIQQPPHGGADFDYQAWALDRAAHGIDATRVWVYPQELGPGTVSVRFMMDDTYGDGIPQAGDVAAVQAYIDTQRPVTAAVTVLAPIAQALDFTISGLDPSTQAVKDAIDAELKDLLRREGEPGGTILISHIREAISIAAGETDHVLVAPAADVAHATGEIPVMGVITWT